MLQVQDPSYNFIKENIINYERKLIQSPFQSLPKPTSKNESKYSICELNNKVQQLINDSPYNLRWIGSGCNSPIEAYMYCLLMLSITNNKTLMQFKTVFYELCRKYLDVKEQKLLIEFLCLLEFSSDKFLFLKKYPAIDTIIFSVFSKLQAEQNYYHHQQRDSSPQVTDSSRFSNECRVSRTLDQPTEDSNTGQLFQMNKLAELYSKFSIKFDFLKWSKSSESSFVFTIDQNKKMHIIIEKQYFFVLQLLQNTEIQSAKAKLTKGDRRQVQRLLSFSQTQSEMNLQQKINYLSEYADKNITKQNQQNFRPKKTVDLESNGKDILVCNSKNHTAVEFTSHFKKQFKFSYFTKKVNSKVEQIHESILNQNQTQKKQMNYIDLMESSFEDEKVERTEKNPIVKQVQESSSVKFYKPKFLMKPLPPPTQMKKNKKSYDQIVNKTEIIKRERSPSAAQKKYAPISAGDKQRKKVQSKQIKFYSPPKLFSQSPEKRNTNKNENEQKRSHDISLKDKRKEDFKYFDKKYNQKKQEIQKHHNLKQGRTSDKNNSNKIETSLSYNPKIFNNRISLQSRKDLDLLAKYKLPTHQLMLNKIPEVDRSEQVSKRELYDKKKIIRQELSQSLNNKSQVLLKKRLFEHLGTKLAGQNLSFLPNNSQKRNKSLEEKQHHLTFQIPKILIRDLGKSKNLQPHRQCPQNLHENKLNGGFQITVKYAFAEQTSDMQ